MCALDSSLQQKETQHSHDIPNEPWSQVEMDLMIHKSKQCLIIFDYFECERIV